MIPRMYTYVFARASYLLRCRFTSAAHASAQAPYLYAVMYGASSL